MQAVIAPQACACGARLLLVRDAGSQGHNLVSGSLPPGTGWQFLNGSGQPIFVCSGWAWPGTGQGAPVLTALREISTREQLNCELRKDGYAICVLTLSDKGSQGLREDRAGPRVLELLSGALKVAYAGHYILPDELAAIRGLLASLAFTQKYDLICTAGGTGVSCRDVTPQATRAVIDYELPGFGEAMRAASLTKTPNAIVSRAICGVAGSCMIINLPGSLKGAAENLEAVLPALAHALAKLGGDTSDCGG